MWRSILVFTLYCLFTTSYGQKKATAPVPYSLELHNGLSEKIGNFSIEVLYHTANTLKPTENLIMSPITMWTVLALTTDGASGETAKQLRRVLRLTGTKRQIRDDFTKIFKWLQIKTDTVELSKFNSMYVDANKILLEKDFIDTAAKYYQTGVASLNFSDGDSAANLINTDISNLTHGRIKNLVESSYFDEAQMLLLSALYFKGQWTSPFNASQTEKKPFYDSNGRTIGHVNMMYNRYIYPFANIKELQARVIELPYGKENRLSMIIMLPNPNISLGEMISKLQNVPLDKVFEELKISKEQYADDEVDCFIPRFKIESVLTMNDILKYMGIKDLFDSSKARLPELARTPLYVSRVVHKAEIEVTEEGTTGSAVTTVEFANRIGIIRFEANRPFGYVIIEKVTNSIVFGGIYEHPILY